MKGIELCAECAYYNMKSHKCTRGCEIEPDSEKGEDVHFFVDCPLPDVQTVKHGYWKDVMMSEATGWDLSLTGGRDEVLETVCSVCGDCCAFGGDGDLYLSPYCPNCGADMRGTEI